MHEIRRMIEVGELTIDALKWKVRRDPTGDTHMSSSTAGTVSVHKLPSQSKYFQMKRECQSDYLLPDLAE